MLRIAYCLYGKNHNVSEGYIHIMNMLRSQTNISIDFYYHVWNTQDTNATPPEVISKLYTPVVSCCQELIPFSDTMYRASVAYTNSSIYEKTYLHTTLAELYSMQAVRDIFLKHSQENTIRYDFVVCSTFHLEIHPTIDIHKLESSKLYVSDAYLPKQVFPTGFFVSSVDIFLHVCNVYTNLPACIDNSSLFEKCKEPCSMSIDNLFEVNLLYTIQSMSKVVYTCNTSSTV
jgi:hypothetical protein